MKTKKAKKILISLWMSGSAGRKHLLGILRFANESTNWSVTIANSTAELSSDMITAGLDGFIGEVTPQVLSTLQENHIPSIVFADSGASAKHIPTTTLFMTDDNEQIGQMGAEYILSLGNFASVAFVPDKSNRPWSLARQRGFENHVMKTVGKQRIDRIRNETLEDWLRQLPKPAAIMAAYDFRAKEVIDACARNNIKIPQQIAVLGVDDDELICEYTQPSLSSIRIDHVDFGYCAAQALNKLLRQKVVKNHKINLYHPADHIIERESTRPIPPATYLVNKILTFIKAHAREPISITDVVRHANVSRRLADLRLKENTGKTIHETLQEVRLNLVRNYLKKTKMPINKISRLSGFRNVQRLKYIFKDHHGVSMREFRRNPSIPKNPE